jgi:hypothetical protein
MPLTYEHWSWEREDGTSLSKKAQVARAAAVIVRSGWSQGGLARASNGSLVDPLDASASKWSATGAILKAEANLNLPQSYTTSDATRYCLANLSAPLEVYNDASGRTAEEVASALEAYATSVGG